MKTLVKDFSYRGRHYSIVTDGKFFMTVEHKFISDDGHLTKELHFHDLHTSKSMEELIKVTKQDLDIEYYLSIGMTKAEAFAKVMDIPLKIAMEIF